MVENTSITVNRPEESVRQPGHPQNLLKALETFSGDEEVLQTHFEEIAKERQRQREEAQQQDME